MGVQSPLTGLVGWETRSDELTRLADDISQIPGGKGLTGTGGGTLPIAMTGLLGSFCSSYIWFEFR